MTSTPAAAARRASATEPTWWKTVTPAAWARPMYGVGSPQKRERTGTRSSRQPATWSSTGKWRSRFTPNGLAVSARTRRISSRKTGGELRAGQVGPHRRGDDRVLDPQQVAEIGSHEYPKGLTDDPAQQPRGHRGLHLPESNHAPAICWSG